MIEQLEPRVVWKPLPGSQTLAMTCPCNFVLFEGTRGPGKGLTFSTPILTDRGWVPAGEVTYNHNLVAPDGTYTKITGIFPQGLKPTYRVTFHDGTTIDCDNSHRWLVRSGKNFHRDGWVVRDTAFLVKAIKNDTYKIPVLSNPAPGLKWDGLDPYIAGQLLGDGTLKGQNPTVYSADKWTKEYFESAGWTCYNYGRSVNMLQYYLKDKFKWFEFLGRNTAATKFVPKTLLNADPEARLAVLQGLMDADGCAEKTGTCRFVSISEQLCKDVVYLVQSLGGVATYTWRDRTDGFESRDGVGGRFIVHVNHCNRFNPFRLPRKANRVKTDKRCDSRRIVGIEYLGEMETICFAVEHESHQFVIDHFVVTHNTDSQLMKFRRYVGLGYGRFWRGIIFDREYKNLDDLVSKSLRWFPEFFDGARWLSSRSDYKWVWPTGEELLFRQAKKKSDYYNYHGQEFPFIGWNELTKYPTSELYDAMMSINRSSFRPQDHPIIDEKTGERSLLPEIPLMVFATTNPYGPGHNWVKLRFIDPSPPGKVIRIVSNVFNPRTQQREDVTKTQVRIFGSYKENIYLSPEYIAELEAITDPNKRKAWLWGDWDVVAGGAFDDKWDESIHVVPRFKIPSGWKIDRTFDWGSSHPFCVSWWAESNGEQATLPDGSQWAPPAGSLILINEWYGSKQIGLNQGLLMSAPDVAKGIRKRESELITEHWVPPGRIRPGPADSQIYQVREKDVDTIGKKMEDYGVYWIPADKSPGSRVNGLELARTMLENAIRGEGPGLFFMDHCRAHIAILPTLPRDEDNLDDVDTEAEDHPWDSVRYRVLKGSNRYATVIPLRFGT